MKLFGQPIALILVGVLLWGLAFAHPLIFLHERSAESGERRKHSAAMDFVADLSSAPGLGDRLLDEEVVGYASEGRIDIRAGGPLEARYYLTQYALAPTLVDHEVASVGEDLSAEAKVSLRGEKRHEFVFAYFGRPRQLQAFLTEHSRQVIASVRPNIALTGPRSD